MLLEILDCIRISYAASQDQIKEAIKRIKEACKLQSLNNQIPYKHKSTITSIVLFCL